MEARAIVDTGPLVAFLNRRDTLHPWALEQFNRVPGPYATTEANVGECCHLLERDHLKGSVRLHDLLQTGLIHVRPFAAKLALVRAQTGRFRDRRVDFADACLLVLADEFPSLPILTADRADFRIYFRRTSHRLILP
jgi:predicted nucleic acid-binding protein